MGFSQVPLGLALAVAIGSLGSGCAGDGEASRPPAAGARSVPAVQPGTHAGHDGQAHDGVHHPARAQAVAEGHAPWTPDAPLIEGMSRIRSAIAGLEVGPTPANVVARATDVDAAIESIFANCRLDPEPDVALHAILARLMAATRALHANPSDATPVADMQAAVAHYEALFDDPHP